MAIGKARSASPPASVITIDRTEAKIGRSIKKRVNTVRTRDQAAGKFPSSPTSAAGSGIVAGACYRAGGRWPRSLGGLFWRAGGAAGGRDRGRCRGIPDERFSGGAGCVNGRTAGGIGGWPCNRASPRVPLGIERPGLDQEVFAPRVFSQANLLHAHGDHHVSGFDSLADLTEPNAQHAWDADIDRDRFVSRDRLALLIHYQLVLGIPDEVRISLFIFGLEHEDLLEILVGLEGLLADHERRVGFADRQPHLHEEPGRDHLVGV